MADIFFGFCVAYGLVFGMRRGFYKELIAFVALVLGVAAARAGRAAAGELVASKSGLSTGVSHVLGAVLVWALVVFIVNLLGRVFLKKARDPDGVNRLEGAAEKAADAAQGNTNPGPVTLITNPIASAQRKIVYWTDKLLGGALGVLKGAIAAYIIFAVVAFFDAHLNDENSGAAAQIRESRAVAFYSAYLDTYLEKLPEYRLVQNVAHTQRLATAVKGDAGKIEKAVNHPQWAKLRDVAAVKALVSDPEVKLAWEKRDSAALLKNSKVRGLLFDAAFRDAFADTDVEAVMRDVGVATKPDAPGTGATPPSGTGATPPPGTGATPPATPDKPGATPPAKDPPEPPKEPAKDAPPPKSP